MTGYGQFCAIARAHETLGGRWTLLIVRELLCGSRRFNEIRRGIPRISRTMLAERLQALTHLGVVRHETGEYHLTPAGQDLMPLVAALATWGQRWLPRHAAAEDLDLDPVLIDMQRQAHLDLLPTTPAVLRIALRGQPLRFMLLKRGEASVCDHNPGFPETLRLGGPLAALVAWWRGDVAFAQARRMGLTLEGPRPLVRAWPGWFERYRFAGIRSEAA
ncbi:winged helix-turn-helix transcriptional regulator [Falsiroseomonas sp.]|uniref:winged helix-turn-helix transcriptional regulator n=1 Tax=Falsiroseomonas sp. TaxID=2870721 RepID=UPI003562428E